MKKFEKFLFFYSILAATIFFISFGLAYPTPLNFISGILFLPIVFYFWIRLTSPQAANSDKWSVRFLLTLVLLFLLGTYGFFMAKSIEPNSTIEALKSQLSEVQRKNEELMERIANSTPEPSPTSLGASVEGESTGDETIADLLLEGSTSSESVHRITGKTGTKLIDVYQSSDTASKKVGVLEPGIKYPYMEKSDGWYKVVVTSTSTGWVSSTQVQEVY